MGYLIGSTEIIEQIARVRPLHEITSLTARAAEWVLENPGILSKNQNLIKESKKYLIEKLKKIGIPIKNTNTNFILLYLPNEGKTAGIAEQFKLNRILVKNPFDKGSQKGWIRVTIGTLEDSERFIKVLKEILSIR